jgi:hypothetical protein
MLSASFSQNSICTPSRFHLYKPLALTDRVVPFVESITSQVTRGSTYSTHVVTGICTDNSRVKISIRFPHCGATNRRLVLSARIESCLSEGFSTSKSSFSAPQAHFYNRSSQIPTDNPLIGSDLRNKSLTMRRQTEHLKIPHRPIVMGDCTGQC